jgi:hypothetical protein
LVGYAERDELWSRDVSMLSGRHADDRRVNGCRRAGDFCRWE